MFLHRLQAAPATPLIVSLFVRRQHRYVHRIITIENLHLEVNPFQIARCIALS
jgi:hypothetical protein